MRAGQRNTFVIFLFALKSVLFYCETGQASALTDYTRARLANPSLSPDQAKSQVLDPEIKKRKSQYRDEQSQRVHRDSSDSSSKARRPTPEELKNREQKQLRRKAYLEAKKGPKKDRAKRMAEFYKKWGKGALKKNPAESASPTGTSTLTSGKSGIQAPTRPSREAVVIDGSKLKREVEFQRPAPPKKDDFSDLPSAPPAELMGP